MTKITYHLYSEHKVFGKETERTYIKELDNENAVWNFFAKMHDYYYTHHKLGDKLDPNVIVSYSAIKQTRNEKGETTDIMILNQSIYTCARIERVINRTIGGNKRK